MRILILSDLHLEFGNLKVTDKMRDVDLVILAGDIHQGLAGVNWAEKYFENSPVLYVPGNHEYYGKDFHELNKRFAIDRKTNVKILNNGTYTKDGITFIGTTLWTDFNLYKDGMSIFYATEGMNDFRVIRGLEGMHGSRLVADELNLKNKLFIKENLASKTVIITHHAPHKKSCDPHFVGDMLTPAFIDSGWESWILDNSPMLWIHGHIHYSSDYTIGKTRVICNPRGYVGRDLNENFNPEMVVEIC